MILFTSKGRSWAYLSKKKSDEFLATGEIISGEYSNAVSPEGYAILDDELNNTAKIYEKHMTGGIGTSYAADVGDLYRLGVTQSEAAEEDNYAVWYLESGFIEYCVDVIRNDSETNSVTVYISKDGTVWDEQNVEPEIKAAGSSSWKHLYYKATGLDSEYKYIKVLFPALESYYSLAIGRVRLNGISYLNIADASLENRASATFYVDSVYGNDNNSGTSASFPFKTLSKVSSKYYQKGDKILFKKGTSYTGTLTIKGHGEEDSEIYVGTYGQGSMPKIYGNADYAVTVKAYNTTVSGLEIVNPNGMVGIQVVPLIDGENPNVTITDCYVHDVHTSISATTTLTRSEGGIIVSTPTVEPAWFNGLTIENNTVKNVNTCGIFVSNMWDNDSTLPTLWGTEAGKPNLNVTVRGNFLDTIGVDGIMVAMSHNVLIENNTLYRGYQCTAENFDNCAGMWVINCNDNVIQYNEVGHMDRKIGQIDGHAFDIDIGCKNTVVQYNYSHDNKGGFLLICSSSELINSAQSHTQYVTVRYNVSIGDGFFDSASEQPLIAMADEVTDIDIYNNTFYMSGAARTVKPITSLHAYSQLRTSKNINIFNNIFHTQDGISVKWDMSQSTDVMIDNNIYSGGAAVATDVEIYSILGNQTVSDVNAKEQTVAFVGTLPNILDGRAVAANLALDEEILGATAVADNGGLDFNGNIITDNFYGAVQQ